MMTRPLDFKPKAIDDFIGPTASTAKLIMAKAVRLKGTGGRFAILLHGMAGVGKTEVGLVVARYLAGHELAIEQLNGQSLSPDKLRDWRSNAPYKQLYGDWTVKVVDELDSISDAAESELLTFLDKLPLNWCFISTTNRRLQTKSEEENGIKKDPGNGKLLVPFRIHSRMQQYLFKGVALDEIAGWLTQRWSIAKAAARDIASANEGNVRGALNDADTHLDMVELAAS